MAGAFQKAKAAAAAATETTSKKSNKETLWMVGNDPNTSSLAEAVDKMVDLTGQVKALETQMDVFKTRLLTYARGQWTSSFGGTGVPPQTPMKIVNRETGKTVTFVVQDRSGSKEISEDVLTALTTILGPGGVDEAVISYFEFRFDPVVMAAPTANNPQKQVQEVIDEELGKLQERLVKQGILTEQQANTLITAEQRRAYRPAFLMNLPRLCANSVSRFVDALGTVGGAVVTFVKAG